MQKYSKFLIALAGVVLTGLNVLYGGNHFVELLISAASAIGVYTVPNKA